jgi:hypothetical protein
MGDAGGKISRLEKIALPGCNALYPIVFRHVHS